MNINSVIQNKNNQLILFFNGWAMDQSAIHHLQSEGYDIISFNDYSHFELNVDDYSQYDKIYLVAWSLGVWVAGQVLSQLDLPIEKAIAINGTLQPIDAAYGIHPVIFAGTLKGWNEKNRTRFMMRTIGGKANFDANQDKFAERTIENQKEELSFLYNAVENQKYTPFHFDTALIGDNDAIFVPKNQINFWEGKADYKTMEMPHYPFLNFTTWEEILNQ